MTGLVECSVASLQAGEPLAGTATEPVSRWILLEVTDPWAPDALETEALPDSVRARLAQWTQEPTSRLQLIRRPGRSGKSHRLMVITAASERQHGAVVEIDRYEDILDIDPAGLSVTAAKPVWLVCVHGRRDRCCAQHGAAVFRALQAQQAEVWQSSHLGGHRFAACVLSLPDNYMYGRVRAEHVTGLLGARQRGDLGPLELLRGRCSYDKPTQAAEIFLRKRLGALGQRDLEWLGTSGEEGSRWEARFVARGVEHGIYVKRDETQVMRPASCGADPEPVTRFIEA